MNNPQILSPARQITAFGRIIPQLVFVLAVAAVLWYWLGGVGEQQREAARRFEQKTSHAVDALKGRFHFYDNIAYASRGLFESSDEVRGDEWHAFILALSMAHDYPGVHSIAFAEYRERAEDSLVGHSADGPDYSVVITHAEPDEEQSGLLGYDLAAEPETRQALNDACASQKPVLSRVMSDPSGGHRIRQVMPVFRNGALRDTEAQRHAALRGWVNINYDVERWLGHFLDTVATEEWSLSIAEEGAEEAFFDSAAPDSAGTSRSGALQQRYAVEIGGRTWILGFSSTPRYEELNASMAVHLFPVSALLLLLFLWLVIRWLQGGRERAMAMAVGMTEQLRESENRYRQMFEANKAIELLIDADSGSIVDANQAAANYYGYTRETLQSMHINDINTLSPEEVEAEMELARSEHRNHFLFKHRHATGEVRDVEVHSGPVSTGGKQLLYSIVHDITARMESERALRESEARYHSIIDTTIEGYWLVDIPSLRIIEVNDALCRMLGYRREELLGRQPFDLADEENRKVLEFQAARMGTVAQRNYEVALKHKDGRDVTVSVHATNLSSGEKEPLQAFAFISDISERKRTEEQLRIAATFFETTSEAIIVTDMNNRIVAVNPAFCLITGYSEEEALGQDPGILGSGRNNSAFYRTMWHTLERMGRWQGEIWNRRKNGEVFPEWLSIVAIKDGNGNTKQFMAVFSDITKRKQDEEKIWRQANYDGLTGLPNRNLFKDRLDQAMHAAHREGTLLALLFIDLDRFKWVNDTLGHAAGDLLLQEAAARLSHCVRETDTVARLGGDEFTVVLNEIHESAEVDRIAEKLLKALAEPFQLDGKEAFLSGSIGITLYPADAEGMERLLRNADTAMYSAKGAGRNVFRYYTQELNEEAKRRLHLEAALHRALEREEFVLYYQPIADSNGEVTGAEALLRWRHPEYGYVAPDEFIPLAEEIGVIVEIEQWVMRQACSDAVSFPQRQATPLFISVNVSSMQCRSDQCRLVLGRILAETGLPAERLKLEITERVMMNNTEFVIALLSEIRTMGVRLAVDDFGTGYSSLSYLKQFPVDVLKIDRAFVSGLPNDKDDMALVEGIIAMAHGLNLQVVAEGVETAEQLTFLRSLGCDMIQGFYFSKPLPFEEFEAYLMKADPRD